jgi:capsular exopolysaccharide synthesis family protein
MNERAMAEYIRNILDDKSSKNQLLLVNSGVNNSLIESQITAYNSLLLQMQSHLEYTTGQNPLIINLEKELNSLRKNIYANVNNHIRTIDIQIKSLQDYHTETNTKITSNPAQAKHLLSIEREQKVKESLYMYLLQKKEENEISLTYKTAPSQIIDFPYGSGKPTKPNRIGVLLAAILLGVLMPLTSLFLRATFDNSVRDRHDVERNCDIPFLGEVPYAGREHSLDSLLMRFGLGRKAKSGGIVVGPDMLNASNEAFRVLRNNMDASFAGNFLNDGGKSYLIKSTEIEVGKTFVAMNLALIRAIGGERVLFIDGDLRQASASRLWGAPLLGLTDFLNGGDDDYRKLLFQPEGYPMLDVLPAGALPTNPTELLKSPLLDQLLMTAKGHYDCIIIDSPTSGMLADADIIERAVDCTMFVIRAGRFNRNQLNEISQIQAINTESKLQYIILNGVNVNARYGYTYLHKYERSEKQKT